MIMTIKRNDVFLIITIIMRMMIIMIDDGKIMIMEYIVVDLPFTGSCFTSPTTLK